MNILNNGHTIQVNAFLLERLCGPIDSLYLVSQPCHREISRKRSDLSPEWPLTLLFPEFESF